MVPRMAGGGGSTSLRSTRVHAEPRLDTVNVDDEDPGTIRLFSAFHAEARTHVDDRKHHTPKVGDPFHVGGRPRYFGHLGQANDLLHRHNVEAELFVLQ